MIIDNKLMKYVLFKKRTEHEVTEKCGTMGYTQDYTDEIIEYLKEAKYIDDEIYVQKFISNALKLKKFSVRELKFDLIKRGIRENIFEKYIGDTEYLHEEESAKYLVNKKYNAGDNLDKIKRYLLGKGYSHSNIEKAIDNLGNINDN